jgi:hypothetical protein
MKSLLNVSVVALCFLTFLEPASYAADFKADVERLGGVFTEPKGYNVVSPVKNRDMSYEYVLQHPKRKYEVRYALRPTPQKAINDYKEWLKTKDQHKGTVVGDPNKWFPLEFQAILFNIGQAAPSTKPAYFPEKAVKAEFGADSGLNAYIRNMKSQFAGPYKECNMVGLHKDGVGQFYIFHLFDSSKESLDLQAETFYSLKFKTSTK